MVNLDNVLPHMLSNEPNAVAMYFTGTEAEGWYYPNIELAKILPADIDARDQDFYKVATPAQDTKKATEWTGVYDDPAGNGLMITASHPIYTTSGTFSGVISMDVALNSIAKNIESYSPIESSYAFLIDQNGKAIALPEQGYKDMLGRGQKKDEFGADLKNVQGDLGAVLQSMRAGKNGFTPAKAGKDNVYISYATIDGTPFRMGIVARQDAVLKVVGDLRSQVQSSTNQTVYLQILPFGIVIMAVVWWLGFIYIGRITEPIKQLTDKTTRISGGDLDVEPATVHTQNEIGLLAASFNHMVTDLRASRHKIEEQNKALLHTEQTRLKASINSLNVGFIMTDTHHQVIVMNGVAERLLRTLSRQSEQPQAAKQSWTVNQISAVFDDSFDFTANFERALSGGKPAEQPEVELHERILHVFMAPIQDDTDGAKRYLGVVVLIEDITEAKMLERSKDDFFSIASHELRTPLTAIRGNSSLIQQIYAKKLKDPDFNSMVNDIHGASVRLINIVNDFLDATRLEQGRIAFNNQPVPIAEIAHAVGTDMHTVADDKHTQIIISKSTDDAPPILADKDRVKQIMYNLLGNALKFTDHGTITIAAEVQGAMLKVLISDTGPGISEANQTMLFHKFQQGANGFLTRESRGTGLGLYISKLLSEQMGGTIALEHSEPGKGTTFSFSLPLANAASEKPKNA